MRDRLTGRRKPIATGLTRSAISPPVLTAMLDIADKLTDDRQVDHRIQLLNDVSQHDRREDQQGG
ncbi:MAG: hypothetical protein ACLVJ6_13850 [Merdibacter sp.]